MKDRQAQEDIWHLTLDDLWAAPPAEPPRLGGEGPFVINLSTSPAPISVPPKDELYIENISVYVITRNEDGRQRFRLRLGPISTELEADAILSAVRERYPGAMTATASEEDLRAIGKVTRNTKGAKSAAAPPPVSDPAPAPQQPAAKNGAMPAAKPVEVKAATPPLAPKPEAKVAAPPPAQKPAAKVAPRPATPRADAKAAGRPGDPHIVTLPPAPVINKGDDSDEPTGTGWQIDSLLPHLAGSAPQPKAKPPAAKAAPVARKVAPPAKPRTPVVAKPAAPAPAPQKPVAATSPASAAPATAQVPPPAPKPPVLTAAVETPKRVAPPASPPVATAAPMATVVPPPIAEIAPPPVVEVAAPPIVEVVPAPVAEVASPPAPKLEALPLIVAEPTPPPVAKAPPAVIVEPPRAPTPPAARELPPITPLPPLTVKNPRVDVRKSHYVRTESVKPAVVEQPTARAPTVAEKEKPPAPAILAADVPHVDPLETDWGAILSVQVEDTQSRPAFHVPAPPEPATVAPAKASDDSGLQRLVERSNAIVQQMDAPLEARPAEPPVVSATLGSPPESIQPAMTAPVAGGSVVAEQVQVPVAATLDSSPIAAEAAPPAVIFSPLNTQSIEQKLAKLAEILHGGGETGAAVPATPPVEAAVPAAPPVEAAVPAAPPVEAAAPAAPPVEAAAPSEPAPVSNAAESDFDVEICFDDDAFITPAPASATKPWFEVDRRQEPRPTLKSPSEVLSAIEEMVVVDEANNLADLMARQKAPVTDAAAETGRTPVLAVTEEPKPQDPPPEAPKLEIAIVDAPIAEPVAAAVTPAVVVATELTLAPEFMLAPAVPTPPVLLEEAIAVRSAQVAELEILAEPAPTSRSAESVIVPQLPELEFTIDEPAPAAPVAPAAQARPAPKAEVAPPPILEAVNVVSTIVLDDPVPKARAEEPHVPTIVLEPTPVVIRSRESAADHATKSAQHLSARAAARAAKKLRLAKDAAKKAAAAAAKSNGSEPTHAIPPPEPKPNPPAQPTPAAQLPSTPQPGHMHASAPAHVPTQAAALPPKASGASAPAHAPASTLSNKKPAAPAHKKLVAKPAATAAKHQPPAARPQPPAAKHEHAPAKPTATPAAPRQAPPAPMRHAASGERKVTIRSEHSTSMDSTQTIRALTPLELADNQISKWYVIQLATSQDDFDPDQIPQLDIFDAFRLYSVIGLDGPKILHALRLGFFSDEISAQAVHGYLKAHFESAAVKRVSIAERERFAESQVEARKDIGATGMHAIIEMASPTPVPETRLADLQNTANQRPAEEKSIWSRLVSPLKRQ